MSTLPAVSEGRVCPELHGGESGSPRAREELGSSGAERSFVLFVTAAVYLCPQSSTHFTLVLKTSFAQPPTPTPYYFPGVGVGGRRSGL